MHRVVGAYVDVVEAIVIHLGVMGGEQGVELHLHALAGGHAVGVDDESSAVVRAIRDELERDGTGSVGHRGRQDDVIGGDSGHHVVVQRRQQRGLFVEAVIDKQRVRRMHVKISQHNGNLHAGGRRVIGVDSQLVVAVGRIVAVQTAAVVDDKVATRAVHRVRHRDDCLSFNAPEGTKHRQ